MIRPIAGLNQSHGRSATWASFDPFIVITTIVLIGFGLITIWSASGAEPLSLSSPVIRQAVNAIIGLAFMLALTLLDYRYVRTFAWVIYGGTLALLVLVEIVGRAIGGSSRWIDFGFFTLQPSEMAKLAVIIALASFIASRGDEMTRFTNFILSGLIVAVPAVIVFQQPDLGTASVFAFVWLIMMLMSGTRLLYLGGLIVAAIPFSFVAWKFIMLDYMRERLLISYQPERDYFGAGFNIIQAQITIGAGGWLGHGLTGSTQSQLDLLRVRTTDFIFAHAMGMFGFVGALALFVTFGILLWRTMHVMQATKDSFGQMMAAGITAMIFFQAFVNVGMNVGLMPVTGIPLPFISLGGSSLWTMLASLGLLQSILIHHRRLGFQPD
jgi:rod shape determining protein RodA